MKYADLGTYATRFVNLVTGLAVSFLALRFVLKMFGANAGNDFVDWVYRTSGELVSPFRGIFSPVRDGNFVIEFSTLFAILIYVLLSMAIIYAINFFDVNEK